MSGNGRSKPKGKAELIRRPCCGAVGALHFLYRGRVRIPHKKGCVYA